MIKNHKFIRFGYKNEQPWKAARPSPEFPKKAIGAALPAEPAGRPVFCFPGRNSREIFKQALPGQTASISLPAGSNVFKEAYSDRDWFGAMEVFGSNGTYQRLKSSSLSDIFSLEENYEYTLTLQTADPSDKKSTRKTRRRRPYKDRPAFE